MPTCSYCFMCYVCIEAPLDHCKCFHQHQRLIIIDILIEETSFFSFGFSNTSLIARNGGRCPTFFTTIYYPLDNLECMETSMSHRELGPVSREMQCTVSSNLNVNALCYLFKDSNSRELLINSHSIRHSQIIRSISINYFLNDFLIN